MGSDLVDRLRSVTDAALGPFPVRFAYVVGSRVQGRPDARSDVDIAVLLVEDTAPAAAERIGGRCADAPGATADVADIQLTVLNDAPVRFVGRVPRQRVVIFSRDEPGRVAYESLLGRMADDIEVWAAPMDRELLCATAEGRR